MVRQGAWALAVLALLPLLAGCAESPKPVAAAPEPSPFFVRADDLQAGRFYAFDHVGGPLALRPAQGTEARFALFDAQDRRVGEYAVNRFAAPSDLRLDGLLAGTYVLHVAILNGTVAIESAEADVLLRPLQGHVERVVLSQRAHNPVPPVPMLPRDTIDEPIHVNLTATPTHLRLLTDGSFGSLRLALAGDGGEVLVVEWSGGKYVLPYFEGVSEIPGTFHADRVQDGRFSGTLFAEDLEGTLILEATGYSRAVPWGQADVSTTTRSPAFTYGLLPPGQPVEFEVAATTQRLFLGPQGDAGRSAASQRTPLAWVAIFDGADRRVATAPVHAGAFTTVAVHGSGRFVAVALSGNVTLGADAAPDSFGLEPLAVRFVDLPARAAGRAGDYGQANETVAGTGVLFDVRPVELHDSVGFPGPAVVCSPGESVRVLQDGVLRAAWGPEWGQAGTAGPVLDDGDATLWHDGFGDSGCPRTGARFLSFER